VSARGRFISLEGGEGAGKSTQAALLAEWLRDRGCAVLVTREPGGSRRAEVLREFLLGGSVAPFGADAEALVFALARADHLAETIRPALQRGEWVVSDRFHDSTWAYQGAAGVAADRLAWLDDVALRGFRPDLTLILDLPVEVGLLRATSRGLPADRFEADTVQQHEARRQAFLQIAVREPERCVVVDATRDPPAVASAIQAALRGRLGSLLDKAG
jgi:dTMP kinase